MLLPRAGADPRLAGRRTDETDEEIKTEIEDATQAIGISSARRRENHSCPTLHADGFGELFLGAITTAADVFGTDIAFPRSGAVGFINDNSSGA